MSSLTLAIRPSYRFTCPVRLSVLWMPMKPKYGSVDLSSCALYGGTTCKIMTCLNVTTILLTTLFSTKTEVESSQWEHISAFPWLKGCGNNVYSLCNSQGELINYNVTKPSVPGRAWASPWRNRWRSCWRRSSPERKNVLWRAIFRAQASAECDRSCSDCAGVVAAVCSVLICHCLRLTSAYHLSPTFSSLQQILPLQQQQQQDDKRTSPPRQTEIGTVSLPAMCRCVHCTTVYSRKHMHNL